MANVKAIDGNPIVVGASGIEDGAITPDKLAEASTAKIDNIYSDLYDETDYESVGWISSDMDDSGAPVESTTRITTQGWRNFGGLCHTCAVDEGYKFKVLLYRASDTPKVVLIDWRTERYDFASDVRKWIVVAAKTDDSAILPADGDEHVHIGTYTPKEVTVDQEDILDSVLPLVSTEPDYTTTPNVIIAYNSGVERSDNNYSATGYVDVRGCKYIVYSRLTFNIGSTPRGGIAFYGYRDVGGYISGEPANGYAESTGYETRICEVPRGASYVRLSINPSIEGFFVRGIPGESTLNGLKFSVLGDSISTYSGYIPAGNAAYYNGSKAGVSSVDQMWWKMLSDTLGMEYLVIDAWGGSAIAYNASTLSTHLDTRRTPMCSDLRTGRLGTENDNPDIIIVAGGTNDWFFGNQDTTPIGDWNGHTDIDRTAVTSGQSTFTESYVSMIEKLQQNYPDAIIVCSSVFFVVAKNAGTIRKNDAGRTIPDYNEAIRTACKLKGVPFIDVFNVGFTYQNYYGTYCTDSATESLHPNALGQSIIAKRYIDELPRLVQQFVR